MRKRLQGGHGTREVQHASSLRYQCPGEVRLRCGPLSLCSKPDTSLLNRENRASAQHKTLEARNTLKLWKKSYFDVRAKIEASGREARWEFDRKRLFERTDYIASICQDLADILQVGATSEMRVDLPDDGGVPAFGLGCRGDLKGPSRERCSGLWLFCRFFLLPLSSISTPSH